MSEKIERVKINPAKVNKGDMMAFVYYAIVENKVEHPTNSVLVVKGVGGHNQPFRVEGNYLIENSFSADYFEREETVSMTECAGILVKAYNKPFTVKFDKADDTERVLRGRLVEPEPLLGRSLCEDLDVKEGSPLRLVDHRTLKMLIVDGIKYVVGRKKMSKSNE